MAKKKNKNKPLDEKKRKLLAILIILFALLIFVSLISFANSDYDKFSKAANPYGVNYANQVGILGVLTSFFLFKYIGWIAYFIPLLMCQYSVKIIKNNWYQKSSAAIRAGMIIGILLTIMTNIYYISEIDYKAVSEASGGVVFYHLTKFFARILGRIGSMILLTAVLVTSIVWLTSKYPLLNKLFGIRINIDLQRFFGSIGEFFTGMFERLKSQSEDDNDSAVKRKRIKPVKEKPSAVEPMDKPVNNIIDNIPEDPDDNIIDKSPAGEAVEKKSAGSRKSDVIGRVTADYKFPDLSLLTDDPETGPSVSEEELGQTANDLRETLKTFNVRIEGHIDIKPGPVITRFEFKPAAGIKVNQIINLSDDLALALKAKRIRIVAPIPGKAAVGIEIPNKNARIVYLKDIIKAKDFTSRKYELPLALGKTIAGRPFITDLAKMPHLLVAGATNSGKSVCVNTMITSLIYRLHPQEIKLILIDPKMLELSVYAGIPHLSRPVITNPKRAEKVLSDAVNEMQTRYEKLAKAGVRNIKDYNQSQEVDSDKMPYIVIIVDELADMMMAAGSSQIEEKLTRLAQMARAVGIHLILATQRPSVDVITGLIKANFPARMAFHVASKTDSRTILDGNGAEKLLGNGDMLFLQPGQPETVRLHGALISGNETQSIVQFINDQIPKEEETEETTEEKKNEDEFADIDLGDPLFLEALRTVISNKQGSVSLLQRKLGIGYQRAARLIDQLEEAKVVATYGGSKARDVLVDESFIERLLAARSLSDSN